MRNKCDSKGDNGENLKGNLMIIMIMIMIIQAQLYGTFLSSQFHNHKKSNSVLVINNTVYQIKLVCETIS